MDGGDCTNFNLFYPGCNKVRDARGIDVSRVGNGICDPSPYNSRECGYDGGDCDIESIIKSKYPLCEKEVPSFGSNWTLVENDVCDMVSSTLCKTHFESLL